MRKQKFLVLAAAAAMAVAVSGCSGTQGGTASTAPKVSLETIADPVQEITADGEEAEIELLSFENPIEFSYSNYDTDMIFEMKDGQWLDGMDSAIPINQERFQGMADQFLHLKAISKVENPGTLEDYNMVYPPYSLYISDSGKGVVEILIGSQDENGNYYATLDEGNFYIISKSTVEALIFDYDSLVVRDTLNLTVTADDIQKAVVTRDGKSTTYKSSDKDAMTRIAAGLSALKPVEFASFNVTASELSNYSLEEASRITFMAEINNGGETQSITIYVGGQADAEGLRHYVQLDGSRMVSYMDSEILTDLLNETAAAE